MRGQLVQLPPFLTLPLLNLAQTGLRQRRLLTNAGKLLLPCLAVGLILIPSLLQGFQAARQGGGFLFNHQLPRFGFLQRRLQCGQFPQMSIVLLLHDLPLAVILGKALVHCGHVLLQHAHLASSLKQPAGLSSPAAGHDASKIQHLAVSRHQQYLTAIGRCDMLHGSQPIRERLHQHHPSQKTMPHIPKILGDGNQIDGTTQQTQRVCFLRLLQGLPPCRGRFGRGDLRLREHKGAPAKRLLLQTRERLGDHLNPLHHPGANMLSQDRLDGDLILLRHLHTFSQHFLHPLTHGAQRGLIPFPSLPIPELLLKDRLQCLPSRFRCHAPGMLLAALFFQPSKTFLHLHDGGGQGRMLCAGGVNVPGGLLPLRMMSGQGCLRFRAFPLTPVLLGLHVLDTAQ